MKKTKRNRTILAAIMTLVMILGCLVVPTPNGVEAASKKKLKVTSAKTVVVGKTIKIKTNVKAKFKSSNKKIATVSSKGTIKAKKAGKVTITVKSGDKTKKCKVTVKNK